MWFAGLQECKEEKINVDWRGQVRFHGGGMTCPGPCWTNSMQVSRWRGRVWKEEHRGENYTVTEVTVNIWTNSQWWVQEAGLPSALQLKHRPLYKPQVSSLPVDSTQIPPVQPSFNTTAFLFPPAPKAFSVRLFFNPHALGAKPSSLARYSVLVTMWHFHSFSRVFQYPFPSFFSQLFQLCLSFVLLSLQTPTWNYLHSLLNCLIHHYISVCKLFVNFLVLCQFSNSFKFFANFPISLLS